MPVALRSVGVSPGASSVSCIIVKPVGLAVGDLMVAHVVSRLEATPVTSPVGWTEIHQKSGLSLRCALFWKIADAADVAAASFTFTVGNESNIGAISAWTGFGAGAPIGANNGQFNASSSTVKSPGIAPPVAFSMILLFASIGDNRTCSTYAIVTSDPGGWVEAYDINTTAGLNCGAAMAYVIRPETTNTGDGTAILSANAVNAGHLVSISPTGLVGGAWNIAPRIQMLSR